MGDKKDKKDKKGGKKKTEKEKNDEVIAAYGGGGEKEAGKSHRDHTHRHRHTGRKETERTPRTNTARPLPFKTVTNLFENTKAVVDEWTTTTGVETVLSMAINKLLSQKELPSNPYPFLIDLIYPWEENYLVSEDRDEDEEIVKLMRNEIATVDQLTFITHPRSNYGVWGLEHTIAYVSAEEARNLEFYAGLLASQSLSVEGHYHVKAGVSVLGSSVYLGSMIPKISELEVDEQFLISGNKLEKAMNNFSRIVMEDVMAKDENVEDFFLNYVLLTRPGKTGAEAETRFSPKDLRTKQKSIASLIKTTISEFGQIKLLGYFRFDSALSSEALVSLSYEYKRFCKSYSFAYKREDGSFDTFEAFRYRLLLRGVFFHKKEADAYSEMYGQDDPLEEGPHVVAYERELKLAVCEGLNDGDYYGLSLKLGELAILENNTEMLPTIYRVHHSLAAEIALLNEQNAFIRRLMRRYRTGHEIVLLEAARFQFELYYAAVMQVLFSNRCSELAPFIQAVSYMLNECCEDDSDSQHSSTSDLLNAQKSAVKLIINDSVDILLQRVDLYLSTVKMSIAYGMFQKAPPAVHHYLSKLPDACGFVLTKDYASKVPEMVINAESESEKIAKRGSFPREVATVSSLVTYSADTHLDEALGTFFSHVFNSILPQNPYPNLVRHLRMYSERMLTFQQPNAMLLELVQNSIEAVEGSVVVYSLRSNSKVFGNRAALLYCDANALSELYGEAKKLKLINTRNVNKGSLVISPCVAFCSSMLIYGRICRHNYRFSLQEHYFAEGPSMETAVKVFVEAIVEHVVKLINLGSHLVRGLFLTENKCYSCLAIKDQNKLKQIKDDLHEAVMQKEEIYIEGFALGDQYTPFRKRLILHFHDPTTSTRFSFCDIKLEWIITNLWFHKSDAFNFADAFSDAIGAVNAGLIATVDRQVVKELREEFRKGDLLDVYRHLFVLASLRENPDFIPAVMRMYASSADRIRFSNHSNQIIRDILDFSSQDTIFSSSVEKAVIEEMFMAYKYNLLDYVTSKDCVFLRGIHRGFGVFLNNVFDDEDLGAMLDSSDTSSLRLVFGYSQALQICVAFHIHLSFPEVDRLVTLEDRSL